MSALNPAAPWRGPLVDTEAVGFDGDDRRAAAGLYSGGVGEFFSPAIWNEGYSACDIAAAYPIYRAIP
jgi:hypothetical protein